MKQRKDRGKTAIVIAWREPEPDLSATVDSASQSVGKAGRVITVQDARRNGPARTRHAGLMAANDCDVAIIVDAHMRFDGRVLRDMAAHVRKHGGLYCAMCHHNPECSFDGSHPSGASYYAGADMAYRGEDQNGRQSLLWKWSADKTPGPRACVGGACYAFRLDWYHDVGDPLAALPGWGCDEEALSISAWLSGHQPAVFDGRVAHRWRPRPPWQINDAEAAAVRGSRAALISAVVADDRDRRELLAWQRADFVNTPEVQRWRAALLKQKRSWAEWRDTVPMRADVAQAVAIPPRKDGPAPKPAACVHDWTTHHRYPNGKRLMRCALCPATRIEGYAR